MRSQPRLSGRHGIATSVQPGNLCIGSPTLGALPARNWYCTSGESSSGRVLTNRPIGAGTGHQRALIGQEHVLQPGCSCGAASCGRPRSSSPRRLAAIDDAAADMVLQVLADAGQFVQHLDAEPAAAARRARCRKVAGSAAS